MTKLLLALLLVGGTVFAIVQVAHMDTAPTAYAQVPVTLTPPGEINPNQAAYTRRSYTLDDPQLSDIPLLIEYVIKFLLGITGALALFFFINGAFEYVWMVPIDKKEEGKNRMIYAIIGLVIILLSYILIDTIIQIVL